MGSKEFNPVIKAVQSLRKLAVDVKNTNGEINVFDHEIRLGIENAGKMVAHLDDALIINKWINKKADVIKNANQLLELLQNVETKFRNKDVSDLTVLWQQHEGYKNTVVGTLDEMKNLGETVFVDNMEADWQKIWKNISNNLNSILSISETYKLKFEMMERLKPEEIDELTNSILKYIPLSYTEEDARNYEEEYIKAYNELKEEQSKKKNFWDKILDVLAGGAIETPAHRVKMRRWAEGEID